ncbi:MAG: 3-hydroxy-3-methylglutaryl-CoA lyase [Hungatella sp.]|nr:3-hydroxy-3-methylglutaryl-CoA lyase [Hungatella sp.]
MQRIQMLDCTLRDGGYCNQWHFGYEHIKKITKGLAEAGIEIIECGFLTEKVSYDKEVTRFPTMNHIGAVIPADREGKLFVCMVNFGEYRLENIPDHDGSSADGIRVAFHKKDMEEALEFCEGIQKKGYKVFIQAMVSLSYRDEEFLGLIRRVNQFKPYAFYIVDSFGVMRRRELIRLFYMIEHNLEESVVIGYHSHNNMQLAFSNAQALADINSRRSLVIDSSILGMGRGAGNLNTELFVEYLNDTTGTEYDLNPLLNLIDEVLNRFYQQNYWGYSLPNYLSAKHNVHPNYAGYLDDKKTLTAQNMDEIFAMMEEGKRAEFDKEYIESLYMRYMTAGQVHEEHLCELKERLSDKRVLLIAPGKSAVEEQKKIERFAGNSDVISMGINSDRHCSYSDFIFLSNLRRFRELDTVKKKKCIVTSNIPADQVYLQTGYRELLNMEEAVKDNAGLMAIKFLINCGVEEIYLAGFDGYSHETRENYGDSHMAFITRNAMLDAINEGMKTILAEYGRLIRIEFLTEQKYISMNRET